SPRRRSSRPSSRRGRPTTSSPLHSWRGIFPELVRLPAIEPPGLAAPEVTDVEGADADSRQLLDLVADRLGHPPDLSLAALAQRDLDLAPPEPLHVRRGGRAILERQPMAQAIEIRLGWGPGELDEIGLRHPVAGMGQPVRELAVVGQQDQAGG